MSLLMKALEKAAKDRGESRPEAVQAPAPATAAAQPASPAASRSELSLEPMAAEPAVASRADAPTHAQPRAREASPRPAAPGASSGPAATPPRDQAQAAAVFQASTARASNSGVGEYLRTHPILAFGGLAALFILGFGIYVYVQIFNPGLLSGRPTIAAKSAPPPGSAPTAPVPAPPAEPVVTAAVLQEAATESSAAPAPEAAEAVAPKQSAPSAPAAREPARSSNAITVSPGSATPALNPLLTEAYSALQSGQVDAAQGSYQRLLSAEPKNTDALLGLAAIAARRGNTEEAVQRYLQILELEPRHALAQSGLIALLGRADPLAAESKLRQLIAREPSAHLYFTLGNLYADQSQWSAAQQAYFQAHHLEPANPDYAYNLAVGLEHVSQVRLALGFYRRALELAAAKGRANFDPAAARERVAKLTQQVE